MYASRSDLQSFGGLPTRVLNQLDSTNITNKLTAASAQCDGYLRVAFAVPLTAPSTDLKIRCSHIAAYMIMGELGFNPEIAPDTIIVKNYDDAVRWLEQVAAGRVVPIDTSDGTPSVDEYGPEAETDSPRGW